MLRRLLYRLYERRLLAGIRQGPVPEHIGVIMDGNRRLARGKGLQPWEGHELGARTLEDLLGWSLEVGVRALTLYAFSNENFQRPVEEVQALMALFASKLRALPEDERIRAHKVRVHILGRSELLPEEVRAAWRHVEEATADHDGLALRLCIAYGGRQEIVDAVRSLVGKAERGELRAEEVDEASFAGELYTGNGCDPDLIIRTGGEARLSNFLLYQAAYAELFFTDVYFPAFRRVDYLRILRAWQQRSRRFGR